MKKSLPGRSLVASLVALLAAGSVAAQLSRPGGENVGIAIEQVGSLLYPPGLLYEAISSGEVRVAISISDEGKLTDHLVVGYTHEEFADAAVKAIKRWKYQPALVRGEARASRAEIVFEFRDQGVIVQTLPGALDQRMLRGAFGERYIYAPCRMGELDETPTPLEKLAKPVIKGDGRTHSVTVEFYIDQEGRARMPAVDRGSADDVYAAAAVMAVEQWRFKPPLRKGRPVLVRAQQVFTFDSKP